MRTSLSSSYTWLRSRLYGASFFNRDHGACYASELPTPRAMLWRPVWQASLLTTSDHTAQTKEKRVSLSNSAACPNRSFCAASIIVMAGILPSAPILVRQLGHKRRLSPRHLETVPLLEQNAREKKHCAAVACGLGVLRPS